MKTIPEKREFIRQYLEKLAEERELKYFYDRMIYYYDCEFNKKYNYNTLVTTSFNIRKGKKVKKKINLFYDFIEYENRSRNRNVWQS